MDNREDVIFNDGLAFDLVNDNALYHELSGYIIANFIDTYDYHFPEGKDFFVKNLAAFLIQKGYKKEDILSGKADDLIKAKISSGQKKEEASPLIIDDDEKIIFSIINQKSEEREVKEYLLANFIDGKQIVFRGESKQELVNRIVKALLNKYSKRDILNGQADAEIDKYMEDYLLRVQSILGDDEDTILLNSYLETIAKKVDVNWYKKSLGAFLLIGSIALGGLVSYRHYEKETINSHNIGRIISAGQTDQDIIKQNSRYDGVNEVTLYVHEGIADDIIYIVNKDPSLFDEVLHETYSKMKIRILPNMEMVFRVLKGKLENNEHLQSLYNEIKDCSSFLDYVVISGRVNDYYNEEVANVISHYKVGGYDGLAEKEQEILTNFMKKYIASKSLNAYNNEESLETLAENVGGRRGN